jgi:hypothetical protein
MELGELYLAIGRPDLGSLMFPGVRGAVVSRRNWARDSWLPALAEARLIEGHEGLPHFGAHKLRATCASMLGYALTPKHVMLDFLGHEQETTTIKHYLRAFRDGKARAREGVAVEEQILQARSLFEPDVADRLANAGQGPGVPARLGRAAWEATMPRSPSLRCSSVFQTPGSRIDAV